jgi:hypothetical protein
MKIDKLIKLTDEQESLCKEMEAMYVRMEKAGIAFTQNENGFLVAYNAKEIADCECSLFGVDADFEPADQNDMRQLFPFWDHDELYLKTK